LRSQIERILNFIRVLAVIHQRQRAFIEDKEDGSRFVIANVEDFEKTMKILAPSIIETVSRLEKRQTEALELIESSSLELWDKNKLAQKLGVSTVTAARILKTLANLGYLSEIQTTKPYSYELIQDREKPQKLILLENIREYKSFYEKELEAENEKLKTTMTEAAKTLTDHVEKEREAAIKSILEKATLAKDELEKLDLDDSCSLSHYASVNRWLKALKRRSHRHATRHTHLKYS